MKRTLLLCLLAALTFAGCGGDGTIVDDDFFFDDDIPDLIAIDDNFSTFQNRTLTVGDSNGVLRNDIICCDDFDLIYDTVSNNGGVVLGRADGSFNYTPPLNFIGTDFFEYTLEDDFGASDGRVTIVVEAPVPVGFFVDSQSGNDATGSGITGAPFATIQTAVGAAGTSTVTVRVGNGLAYTGAVNLGTGQTIVGEGFESFPPTTGAVRPLLGGPVNMGDNCTVRGLRIENSPAVAVDGRGRNQGVVADCQMVGAGDYALDLVNAQGNWDVEGNLVENCLGGFDATSSASSTLSLLATSNTFRNNTESAVLLTAEDSSDLICGLVNNIFSGNQVGLTVSAASLDTASICLDLVGNLSDDTYRLTRNSASFQVEQLAQLTTLNTGTVTVGGDPLQDVANGFCGF